MIIAGNFKTNHTRSSTLSYCKELEKLLKKASAEVYVFPPISAMPYNDFSSFSIGSQNAYPTHFGAYTGEIGLMQLLELKIKTLMIGHSERRMLLKEDKEQIKAKFDFFFKEGFKIFFCIGESQEVRKNGKIEEFLANQLKGIDLSYPHLILAYEPLWAIGTGESASLEEIKKVHSFLHSLGAKKVIYGGSVNVKNAKEIMSLENVEGVLVGGASLQIESFYQIIQKGEELC